MKKYICVVMLQTKPFNGVAGSVKIVSNIYVILSVIFLNKTQTMRCILRVSTVSNTSKPFYDV